MSLSRWRTLSRKELFQNPWWIYRQDTFLLPDGEVGEYNYVHTNGSSMIVPVLGDGKIILVNQYRYLCDRESLELPCGGVKSGSDYQATAVSELEEEAGYRAKDLRHVGQFNPFNGVTNEFCRVYVARDLEHVGPKPEHTEEFEHIELRPEEIDGRIRSGEIWDGMTIAGWTVARPFLQ